MSYPDHFSEKSPSSHVLEHRRENRQVEVFSGRQVDGTIPHLLPRPLPLCPPADRQGYRKPPDLNREETWPAQEAGKRADRDKKAREMNHDCLSMSPISYWGLLTFHRELQSLVQCGAFLETCSLANPRSRCADIQSKILDFSVTSLPISTF